MPEDVKVAVGEAVASDHTSLSPLQSRWAKLYLRANLHTRGRPVEWDPGRTRLSK